MYLQIKHPSLLYDAASSARLCAFVFTYAKKKKKTNIFSHDAALSQACMRGKALICMHTCWSHIIMEVFSSCCLKNKRECLVGFEVFVSLLGG